MSSFNFSPFRRIIEIMIGIYMESGFLELLSSAICSADTFKPALLHYNSETTAYMASVTNPLNGGIQTDALTPFFIGEDLAEGESKSVGCSNKVSSITVCDVLYTQPGPTYCNTDEIRRIKFIQSKIKPSIFSGKLQLFVQALYGSRRNDYTTFEGNITLDYPLFVGGIQLHYTYAAGTSGILSGANFTYFLIHIASSTTARELIPSAHGLELRTHLIANSASMTAAEIKKVEAYILSTCSISPTVQSISLDLSTVIGDPIAYGWHFNSSGTKADIIVHRDNLPTDQNHHAYHYTIDFSESSGVVSATLTAGTSNQVWSSVHGCNVFKPDYVSGQMIAVINPLKDPPTTWANPATFNANIYCYYDDADLLHLISVEKFAIAAGSVLNFLTTYGIQNGYVEELIQKTWIAGSQLAVLDNANLLCQTEKITRYSPYILQYFDYVGQTTPSSHYLVPSFGLPDTSVVQGTSLDQQQFALSQGWYDPALSGAGLNTGRTAPGGETIYLGRSFLVNSGFRHWKRAGANDYVYVTAKTSTVIPYDSCNSVIATQRSSETVAGAGYIYTQEFNVTNPGVTSAEVRYHDYYTTGGTGVVVYSNIRGPFNLSNRHHAQSGAASAEIKHFNGSYHSVTIASATSKEVYGAIYSELSTFNSTTWAKYFDIQFLVDPIGYFHSFSKQSMLSADYVSFDGAFGLKNVDWLNDLAIGWA